MLGEKDHHIFSRINPLIDYKRNGEKGEKGGDRGYGLVSKSTECRSNVLQHSNVLQPHVYCVYMYSISPYQIGIDGREDIGGYFFPR